MDKRHFSEEVMQEFLDGSLPPARADEIEGHCQECDSCSAGLRSLRQVDGALRNLPLESPGHRFTATVMENILGSSSAAFRLLEYTAYFFGFLIVAAISAAAFFVAGGEGTGVMNVAGSFHAWSEVAMKELNNVTLYAVDSPGVKIVIMMILSVGCIALVDRLLWRRMGHRS